MSELLHNEFPPESLEGKDLAHLLHPTTNLKLHRQQGPSIHEKAEGVYLWDFAAGICLVKEAGGKAEFTLIDDERYSVRFSNGKL